ncbi:MAG: inositol monophosphatase [Rhizobiaceae bacterium]|nr:MAG: inositol monophosphatase [Rhizobiaceae bacterium]CAG1015772.1 Fructose-1, 6-bisphosphatase/inositol-1-monophosphatase [Rhizobiaceae bacterium]
MRFDDASIEALEDIVVEAAKAEIMPRFRRLSADDVRRKTSAADLVTEADVRAERLIAERLRRRWPGALIVGEEACSEDPARLAGLEEADLAFVVDPVDGTFNFASGVPLFGVMLAVVVAGETVAGLIHDPVGGDTLIGAAGAGSHILRGDRTRETVRVAEPVPFAEMTGSVSWQYFAEPQRSLLARNQTRTLAAFGYRCSAHEYRLLASGHAHFVVYNKLMPWDHLAGVLIHSEAGGHTARIDGSRYRPSHLSGGLIAAPDRDSWAEIRRELWAGA